jgi:hypothetical protein
MDTRFQANENDETAVHLIKTAVKENQFELMETILLLGKISVYLPNTIQVPCLG